nr:hypothetical protein [Tanacetum cinerariifolium]
MCSIIADTICILASELRGKETVSECGGEDEWRYYETDFSYIFLALIACWITMGEDEPYHGTTAPRECVTAGYAANYGSASGSNNKSNRENGNNGQKDSNYTVIVEGGDNGAAERIKAANGSGSKSGADQDQLALRNKFVYKSKGSLHQRCALPSITRM